MSSLTLKAGSYCRMVSYRRENVIQYVLTPVESSREATPQVGHIVDSRMTYYDLDQIDKMMKSADLFELVSDI